MSRVSFILTILSCENPSNIWELNYGPQMCGANKHTGKMELVLLLNERTSLFSHGTFQRSVFVLSTWFVRTSGNNLNYTLQWNKSISKVSRLLWSRLETFWPCFALKNSTKERGNLNHYLLCQIFDNMNYWGFVFLLFFDIQQPIF